MAHKIEDEKKLKKLYELIERWIYYGKPPRKGMPPAYCDYLCIAYNDLIKNQQITTSWECVVEVLKKCGFRYEQDEHNVYWTFYLS